MFPIPLIVSLNLGFTVSPNRRATDSESDHLVIAHSESEVEREKRRKRKEDIKPLKKPKEAQRTKKGNLTVIFWSEAPLWTCCSVLTQSVRGVTFFLILAFILRKIIFNANFIVLWQIYMFVNVNNINQLKQLH